MTSLKDKLKLRVNRIVDNRICIGITGLSQSGKSTFITSFINQLKNHDAKNSKLGKFSAAINHKIHHVKTHPLEDSTLALFDYEGAVKGLSGSEPTWPISTIDISGVLIEIVLKNGKTLFGKNAFKNVFVEIRDYPGEWLVDLPMMEMNYHDWSLFIHQQLVQSPRKEIDNNRLKALLTIGPLEPYNPATIATLKGKYNKFLMDCKLQSPPLSLMQPGRFLQPGKFEGSPLLDFIPMPSIVGMDPKVLKKADKSSFYKILESRFEQYKSECIQSFFKDFIAPIEHQVVLVDVLNALNGGPNYLNDMVDALNMISSCFKYKKGFFSSSIKQVHYIATKVDHAFIRDHDNINHLLAAIVKRSLERVKDHQLKFKIDSVASVRSSIEDTDQASGKPVIRAYDETGNIIKYAPPRIPEHIPEGTEWDAFSGWRWPRLNPPKDTRVYRDQAIQHIRMDYVIESLIGELCD